MSKRSINSNASCGLNPIFSSFILQLASGEQMRTEVVEEGEWSLDSLSLEGKNGGNIYA